MILWGWAATLLSGPTVQGGLSTVIDKQGQYPPVDIADILRFLRLGYNLYNTQYSNLTSWALMGGISL